MAMRKHLSNWSQRPMEMDGVSIVWTGRPMGSFTGHGVPVPALTHLRGGYDSFEARPPVCFSFLAIAVPPM